MSELTILVIAALFVVVLGCAIIAWVVVRTPESANLELSKIRFAAATFSGILFLIVFASILFYAKPDSPGKEIFGAIVPAVTPIMGAVIGYLFGTSGMNASSNCKCGNEQGREITLPDGGSRASIVNLDSRASL